MRRREFITLLGGAAAAAIFLPRSAHAQQAARLVLGFLASGELKSVPVSMAGFLTGLKDAGFVDGQNPTIDYRWAENNSTD